MRNILPSLTLLLLYSSCGLFNNESSISFQVTVISAVEVALEVSADSGDKITITRDGSELYSFRMNAKDTVFYDSSLEPNTSYIWKAVNTSSRRDKNKERQATTFTTTSSKFTWQTFRFGDHSSSTLYGVSIIDENNIWAVGELYINDSTGQSEDTPYNVMHWDGTVWTVKKAETSFRGNLVSLPLESIQSFSETNIWLVGSLPIYGNGVNWELFDLRTTVNESLSLWKVWGEDSNDIYFGGNNGSIAHYNGEVWQKIESETELDIEDIHGNEEQGVIAVASELFASLDKAILRINDNQTVELLSTEGIPEPISGIWYDETGVSYIVGSGMFRKPKIDSPTSWQAFHRSITNNYMNAIDANGLSDIVTSGNSGEILHFNGITWTSWQNGLAGTLYDIDIRQDIIVAVGYDGGEAFITIGNRL